MLSLRTGRSRTRLHSLFRRNEGEVPENAVQAALPVGSGGRILTTGTQQEKV